MLDYDLAREFEEEVETRSRCLVCLMPVELCVHFIPIKADYFIKFKDGKPLDPVTGEPMECP